MEYFYFISITEIFKLISKDYTDIDGGEENNLSEQSGSRAKKEYVKLQIQKRKQQRIQDLIKKREEEETKLKNLKELKDKQLKLVQNNVRRARQRQQQQQDQEAAEVSTYVPYKAMISLCDFRKVWCHRKASQYHAWQLGAMQVFDMQNTRDTL
jgi:hypothetical protein